MEDVFSQASTLTHEDALAMRAVGLAGYTHLIAEIDGVQERHVGLEGRQVSGLHGSAGPHVCMAKSRRVPQPQLLE